MAKYYGPITNPGETRTRMRYMGIWSNLGQDKKLDILEQEVIMTSDLEEKKLEDTNGFNKVLTAEVLAEQHPVLNAETDEALSQGELDAIAAAITNGVVTPAMVMTLVYSNVRYWQDELNQPEESSSSSSSA